MQAAITVFIAFVFSMFLLATSFKHDMQVCQLSHSHDTCFQALNR